MIRPLVVAVATVALTLAGVVGLVHSPPPTTPPTLAVGPVPVSGSDLDVLIESLQQRLRQLPADHVAWSTLALAYVEKGRLTGDGGVYRKADQAVRRSLTVQPEDNPAGLAAGAALAAARHDFDRALQRAEQALTLNPYEPVALAIRVDALTELGRYDDQLHALKNADRRQPGTPIAVRYAYAKELRGRPDDAIRVLRRSLSATPASADRLHLLTLIADLERRRGRLAASRRALDEASGLDPRYTPAMVSSARLAVATGRLDLAARRWEAVTRVLPAPEYLVELGELHLFLGDQQKADEQFAVVQAATRLLADGGVNTDLESALFEADHADPTKALAAARAEYERRRSVHAADALGWALHRTGRSEDAATLLRRATRLGTVEARLWLHRGIVEAALGREADAAQHLRKGIAMDPGASPWQIQRARRVLAELGGQP